jgi:hypothetical protein
MDQDDRRVSVYLTPQEKEAIRRLAFAEKMTPSKFVRKMLLEQTDLQEHVTSFFGENAAQSTHLEDVGTRP